MRGDKGKASEATIGGSTSAALRDGGQGKVETPEDKRVPKLFGSAIAYRVAQLTLTLFLAFGVGMMLYPFAKRAKFAYESVNKAREYRDAIDEIDDAVLEAQWYLAQEYNRARAYNRAHGTNTIIDPFRKDVVTMEVNAEYWSLINPLGDGMMGYLDIPKIGERLNIYHGTDEDALRRGVGHLQGTSLPVGGEGTRCVLSGHRGLAGAKIFTDLDQVEIGDLVLLHILNHDLAYEVDAIDVVEPQEIASIDIVEGLDLLTLVTCTPYGVNTHRLLVTGHALPYEEKPMPVADAMAHFSPVLLVAAAILIFAIIVAVTIVCRRGSKGERC